MDKLFYCFEIAFKHFFHLSMLAQILFLIIIGAFFSLKDWKTYLLIILALCSGLLLGLSLSVFKVINASGATINLLVIASLVIVSLHGVLSKRITTLHYNIFVLIGIMQGFIFGTHCKIAMAYKFNFLSFLGYNLGSYSAILVISFLSIIICSLIISFFKTDNHKISLVLSGLGLGVALMMYL